MTTTVWSWYKNRQVDHWDRREDPDINQRSADKGVNTCSRKEGLFNKRFWQNSVPQRIKLDPYLSPCTKLNLKWTKNLNLKPFWNVAPAIGEEGECSSRHWAISVLIRETSLNRRELDNVGEWETWEHSVLMGCLSQIPPCKALGSTWKKMGLLKYIKFRHGKETNSTQPTEQEKIFASYARQH